MTTQSRILQILDARRGMLFCAVMVILSLVLLIEGRAWFDRLAGLPVADELLVVGTMSGNATWTEAGFRRGASPNARDRFGNTPLMWAALAGDQQLVRRLIAAGADVSAKSELMTPLSAAAMGGQLEVVEILLDAGAEVDQRAIFQNTALHQAAAGSHEMMVELLLNRGAAVNARNDTGRTPLLLVTNGDEQAAMPCVRRLMHSGADVNAVDVHGATVLMAAANDGQDQLVTLLLEFGADTTVRDYRQQTAGTLARSAGHDVLGARLEPERRAAVSPPHMTPEPVYGVQRAD